MKMKKGFTLIELLIVITIIGILSVALLPSLLGAPAKARDAARQADLLKIQKVLSAGDLEGESYPDGAAAGNGLSNCIGVDGTFNYYLPSLGGAIPKDPNDLAVGGCAGEYKYVKMSTAGETASGYSYALIAKVEDVANGNYACTATGATVPTIAGANMTLIDQGDATALCYAVLVQ